MKSKTYRLLHGSSLSLLAQVLRVISVLIITPIILAALGVRWYGMWSVVVTTIGQLTLIDFGLASSTQYHMGLSIARSDFAHASRVFSNSLMQYTGIGLLIVAAGGTVALSSGLFFHDPADARVFALCIIICAVDLGLALPFQAIHGTLNANLRTDLTSTIEIGALLLRFFMVNLALHFGFSIVGLAAAQLLTNLMMRPISLLVFVRQFPLIKFRRNLYNFALVKELYGYGFWTLIIIFTRDIRLRVDNIILGSFRGLESIPVFSFASALIEHYLAITVRSLGMTGSLFAQYFARKDWENLQEKFLILSRVSALVACLFGGGLIVFGRQFLMLWVGPQFEASYLPMALLAGGFMINITLWPGSDLLRSIGKHKQYSKLCLCEMAMKLALSITLAGPFGATGVACATLAPLLAISLGYLLWYPSMQIGVSVRTYVFEIVRVFVPLLVLQMGLYFLVQGIQFSRLITLLAFAASTYAILLPMSALLLLRKVERDLILGTLHRLLAK